MNRSLRYRLDKLSTKRDMINEEICDIESQILSIHKHKIISIKRLSDGMVFKIGDSIHEKLSYPKPHNSESIIIRRIVKQTEDFYRFESHELNNCGGHREHLSNKTILMEYAIKD